MKRPVSDVIRRGFSNTLANWQLLLIRVAESAVAFMIVIATLLAAVVPVVVTAFRGSGFDLEHPDRFLDSVIELITEHYLLIAWLVVLATLVLGLILAVRSFVEAGTARIFFDGEAAETTTGKFAAFDVQRWFDGGKQSWWPVFLIYNIVGCIALLVAIVPILLVAMVFTIGGTESTMLGCLVIPLVILSLVAMAIVAALWNQKAIVVCVARGLGGVAAVRAGWRELMDDFPRHLGVGVLIALLTFGAAMLLSLMSIGAGFSNHNGMATAFAPMQMIASFAQTSVSAIAGTWFIACFVALTSDNRS
ncbi:MAG: hypothetical protein QOI24_1974 [Acidobacteriota bacterium]|nr:hypothetical protein [Acidobacteriota bacterium]